MRSNRSDTDRPGSSALDRLAGEAHLNGDWSTALRFLIQAHGQSLHRYCRHLVRDKRLADDVCQTVLLQAFSDLPSFSGRSPFRVWLYAIARYRCMDALRTSRSRRRYVVQEEEATDIEDPRATPEEQLMISVRHRVLRSRLSQLPAKTRQVLELRYYERLSYEEMARRCGEPPVTLRVRVARALPQLRRLMEEAGHGDAS